jgi:APA family basic amino acid/polyamine antiporter
VTTLKRNITFPLLLFYGLGTILGAGIYVLTGVVASHAGQFTPLAFFLAALVAAPTAFSYAALSSRYPKSAGEAIYVKEAFKSLGLGTVTGLLVIIVGIVSAATIANGFVGYFSLFSDLPAAAVIFLLVIILAATAIYGIVQSVAIASVIAVVEIIGLMIVVHGGWMQPSYIEVELVPPVNGIVWSGVFAGAFLAFYAFIGFEDIVNLAEETKRPELNVPLAIIGSLLIASVLYFLVAYVAVTTVPIAELSSHPAPMALVVERHGIYDPELIAIISMLAVINGALVQIRMASRVLYGILNINLEDHFLADINPTTRTPINATLLVSAAVLILAIGLDLESLATLTSAVTLIIFMAINLSLLVITSNESWHTNIIPGSGFLLCLGLFLSAFSG